MGLRLYQSRQDTAARLVIAVFILVCELVKNLSVLIITVAGMAGADFNASNVLSAIGGVVIPFTHVKM